MEERDFTVIDEDRVHEVSATVDGEVVRLSPAALREALGWELKPQGLCKEGRCVPLADAEDLQDERGKKILLVAYASW